MTRHDRRQLELRLLEIDFALFELGEGRVVDGDGDPDEVERELHAEQNAIVHCLVAEPEDAR